MKICVEKGDSWAEVVKARLMHVHDLPAAEAVYHQSCSSNFRTKKQIPKSFSLETPNFKRAKHAGRPQDSSRNDAFVRVAEWLTENDDEQVTITDLVDKMQEYLGDTASAYSAKYMKNKIQEHFGHQIVIAEMNGKSDVVTLHATASAILHDFNKRQASFDADTEKNYIIETAAKLIKSDIKSMKSENDFYPEISEDMDEAQRFLPVSLKKLLEGILLNKKSLKLASIGQAIIQGTRPRVVTAPLQVGLGIQLHHHFSSRFLIDTLHRHGFCVSYSEVQRFNENAAMENGTDIPSYNGEFSQHTADNADHNVRTLDGNDTFHGMGIVASITPGTASAISCIPRKNVTQEQIATAGKVEIVPASATCQGEIKVVYEEIPMIIVNDPMASLDVLWKSSLLLGTNCPSWSGMMQKAVDGEHRGKASIHFLPMIDLNPSDMTCVNSTLHFVLNHVKSNGIPNTPIITFDQPLWWKAYTIVKTEPEDSELRKFVVRLGGFHALMSFLGTIGHLMAESGLKELLELIYASNAVDHMMSGKAIARAVRGHLIIDAALNALLYSSTLGVSIPNIQQSKSSIIFSFLFVV